MKRSLVLVLALSLALVMVIAGCTNEPAPTPVPENTAMPTDPLGAATPGTDGGMTPGLTPGGTGTGTAMIPDFAEGTEVTEADVPHIKSALQERYEGATIKRITHATRNGMQVYSVEYAAQDGTVNTIYIGPDGAFIPENGTTDGTATPPADGAKNGGAGAGGAGTAGAVGTP